MPEQDKCSFCIPESQYLFDDVRYNRKDYETLVAGMEIIGDKLSCGNSKLQCVPMQRIQRGIDKFDKQHGKK